MSHPPPDAMSSTSSSSTSGSRPFQSFPAHGQHRPSQGGMRNYTYRLEVAQQPVRARMCGFGDKDRRPITPPPCIKLRVYDETGQEVHNISDVDCNFFVLSVDLWDVAGTQEQNLVMHPSNTSAAALAGANNGSQNTPMAYQQQAWGTSPPPSMDNGHYHHPSDYPPQSGYMYGTNSNYAPGYSGYNQASTSMHHFNQHDDYSAPPVQGGTGQPFTRNLIGSLTASAFRLKDDKDQIGIWFVLQDLSVRTEGSFRLKFSFLNLGSPLENGSHRGSGVTLNTGKSKVLTTAMSDPFQVFSAKKFPGMIESTALSKKFASQGIRIPVRHSGDKNADDDEDD